MNGMALPSWLLTPGTVLLRRHVRNKGLPLLRSSGACGRGSHLFGCAFTGWQRKHSLYFRSVSVPSSRRMRGPADPALPETDGVGVGDVGGGSGRS